MMVTLILIMDKKSNIFITMLLTFFSETIPKIIRKNNNHII